MPKGEIKSNSIEVSLSIYCLAKVFVVISRLGLWQLTIDYFGYAIYIQILALDHFVLVDI